LNDGGGGGGDDDGYNNSILYYFSAESIATRPNTDTAQCRYR
jgi:hypothetical protein